MSDINIQVNVIAKAAQAAVQQLERQTEAATKGFEQLNKSVSTISQTFANFAGAVARDIFNSVISGAKALVVGTVDLQIELEKLQTKFESLTGSAESAKNLLEELNAFSDESPFEFPEIANAAQKLLTFGVEARNVKDVLKTLGDISAASGANIEELALAFGKVSSSGFVTGREISQLQNNAIPILDALSQQLGVTTASVRKLANEGKISASDFELALIRLGREGGFAFQAMEKQGGTLQGSLKQVQDAVENLQKALGENLSPILKSTLQGLANLINTTIVPGLTATIKLLKQFFDFTTQSTEFHAILVGIGTAFTAIAVRAGIAAAATISYSGIIGALSAQLMLLQIRAVTAWVALTGPVSLAVAGVAAVAAGVFYLYKNWDTVRLKVLEAWATTKEFFGRNAEGIRQQIALLKEEIATRQEQNKQQGYNKKELSELEELRKQQLDLNNQEKKDLVDLTQKQNELNLAKNSGGTAGQPGLDAAEVAKKAEEVRVARLQAEAKLTDDLLAAQQARALALAEQQALENGIKTEQEELAILELQNKLAKEREITQLSYSEKIGDLQQYNILKTKIDADQIARETQIKEKAAAAERRLQETLASQKENINRGYWGLAAALAKNGSKEQFAIQKAAAIAELWLARGKALGAIPAQTALLPAPAVPAAAAALTANANTAFGIGLATVVASAIQGFQDGGIVSGNSFSGDRVLARVNSGEMILNRQQQAQLFEMANRGGSGEQMIQTNITVELDGEVVARSVSRQVANGLKLGEVV